MVIKSLQTKNRSKLLNLITSISQQMSYFLKSEAASEAALTTSDDRPVVLTCVVLTRRKVLRIGNEGEAVTTHVPLGMQRTRIYR